MANRKISWFAYLRLVTSGAIVGMVIASMVGVDISEHINQGFLSGAVGAAITAIGLKVSPLFI